MRTIKFRAFDDGEMLTMQNDGIIELSTFFGLIREDAILMQFTGLIDKNGREIYEGDVIDVDCSSVGGSFDDGRYLVKYVIPDCAFVLEQLDGMSGIMFNECYIYKIIGNLYENPELIK